MPPSLAERMAGKKELDGCPGAAPETLEGTPGRSGACRNRMQPMGALPGTRKSPGGALFFCTLCTGNDMSSMTVRDLAERLAVPELRVYRAVQDGLIPHYRIGRSIRFDAQAIEEWIQSGGTAVARETAGVS